MTQNLGDEYSEALRSQMPSHKSVIPGTFNKAELQKGDSGSGWKYLSNSFLSFLTDKEVGFSNYLWTCLWARWCVWVTDSSV